MGATTRLEASPALAILPAGWAVADVAGSCRSEQARPVWTDDVGGLTIYRPASDRYEVEFTGIARFRVDCGARRIGVERFIPDLSADTLEHLLLDQLLPRLLDQQGALVVHAAAVDIEGSAILVAGDSGRGKSTLAAALARQGRPLLGDDGVTLTADRNDVQVSALYPSLRLLPDSIAALYGSERKTMPTASYTPKRRVSEVAVPRPALCCRALFVLAPADRTSRETIRIERIDPVRACVELLRESFALDPSDKLQAARRMGQAARVAELVPAFELAYPREYELLPAVGEALTAAVETIR